ncbi:MAG: recombinase family protein [Butyrivibrio sp.]|nr:recombinase family protein [Butyrivibrio sp.]
MAKQKKFVQNNNNLAIAYYRYSSHAQNEASIAQQREAAEKYAEAHGFTIMKEYADEALSGTSDDRPKFQLLLNTMRNTTKRRITSEVWKPS